MSMNCQNFHRGGSAPAPPEMYNVIHSELHSQARLGRARNLGQRFDPKTGVVEVLVFHGTAERAVEEKRIYKKKILRLFHYIEG